MQPFSLTFILVQIGMMYSLDSILKKTETELADVSFNGAPAGLFDPIEYIMSLGGKRIRPALTLIGCNIFADDISVAVKPALGIEVFHNFTLLHDDLMDDADKRRNKSTVHVRWNPNTAILSGDAMLIVAYKLIGETDPTYLQAVLSLFSETALDICRGQQYDVDFEQRMDVTEEEYIRMIKLKTAVLLACSLKIGALLGGASCQDADILYEYGTDLGLAFQLQDDLLDVYGNSDTFGKNIGGDILSNKKTFLLINALQRVEGEKKQEVLSWLEKTDFDPAEKIAYFTSLYTDLGVKQLTEMKVQYYYEKAKESLADLNVPDARLSVLTEVGEKLMRRNV